MKDFRNLKVWQKAHNLTLALYKLTTRFSKDELYGLASQIRRARVSLPANIAEGCGRRTDRELCQFLVISLGSASELEYYLLLSRELGFVTNTDHDQLAGDLTEVKKMLNAFIQRLIAKSQ